MPSWALDASQAGLAHTLPRACISTVDLPWRAPPQREMGVKQQQTWAWSVCSVGRGGTGDMTAVMHERGLREMVALMWLRSRLMPEDCVVTG